MNFFCIADRDSSLGFRLCGIETKEVSSKNETLLTLKAALEKEGTGVILITGKVASLVRDEVDKLMYSSKLPLILEIPSRGETTARKSAGDFLKQAIGVNI